jgi:hypothetical protein
LECLVVFEVVGFVIDHPRRFLVLLCRSWLNVNGGICAVGFGGE